MNVITVVVIALVVAAVVAGFIAASSRAESRPIVDPKEGYEMYISLRGGVLAGSRVEFHLDRTSPDTEPWGVLMETGFPEGSMTLVTICDGNASIYLSSGGGCIGGGDHESIREAAKKVVKLAGEFQPLMTLTQDFPLPQAEEMIFYVLTDAGVYTGKAPEEDLIEERHPLSPLGYAGHEVITQFRVLGLFG